LPVKTVPHYMNIALMTFEYGVNFLYLWVFSVRIVVEKKSRSRKRTARLCV